MNDHRESAIGYSVEYLSDDVFGGWFLTPVFLLVYLPEPAALGEGFGPSLLHDGLSQDLVGLLWGNSRCPSRLSTSLSQLCGAAGTAAAMRTPALDR